MGRMILAVGVFVGVLLVWPSTDPATTLVATLTLLTTLVVTAVGVWHTYVRERVLGRGFLYTQIVFDTLLVTAIVHLTGGGASDFAPLYILVIVAGALLLPLPGGVLIGVLASLLYFTDIVWLHDTLPAASVFVQIGLFTIMALVTGLLGDRLRRTGTLLGIVESELRQLRLETNDILDAIDTGVITVDAEGRVAYINRAATTLLELTGNPPKPSRTVSMNTPSEWKGLQVLDLLDQRAPGLGAQLRHSLETGLAVPWYETRAELTKTRGRSETNKRSIGVRTTVMRDDDDGRATAAQNAGKTAWATAVVQDITDSKRLEELNRRAERLQAIGELAASLAHEIRNPLASIRSAVEQITDDRLAVEDKTTLQHLVKNESDRLSRLLSEFIEFSRVRLRERTTVDLGTLVANAIELVRRHPSGKPEVRIDYHLQSEPVEIIGDGDLLHRLAFNLILNAVQNSPSDTAVRVEVGPVNRADRPAVVAFDSPVCISVSDTGPGVPAQDLGRLFDPFFTTREGGAGLGLAVVHRAVDEHHGTVLVDREPGRGARFNVYLPSQ